MNESDYRVVCGFLFGVTVGLSLLQVFFMAKEWVNDLVEWPPPEEWLKAWAKSPVPHLHDIVSVRDARLVWHRFWWRRQVTEKPAQVIGIHRAHQQFLVRDRLGEVNWYPSHAILVTMPASMEEGS